MSLLVIELITAGFVLVTAGIGLIVRKKINQVHILVNDRMTQALNRIDQLVLALTEAGIVVPEHPTREDGESEA